MLTRSLLLVTLAVPLAGCSGAVAEFEILKSYVKSLAVEYANQDAWSCDLAKSTSTKGVVEDCGACRNVSGLSQAVTINGERSQVELGGTVLRCSDRAWVRDTTMPPIAATPTAPSPKPPAAAQARR
jgi:flagellar basal body L-ring protein FlgH